MPSTSTALMRSILMTTVCAKPIPEWPPFVRLRLTFSATAHWTSADTSSTVVGSAMAAGKAEWVRARGPHARARS